MRRAKVLDVGVRNLALGRDVHHGQTTDGKALRRLTEPAPGDLIAGVEHVQSLGATSRRSSVEGGLESHGGRDGDRFELLADLSVDAVWFSQFVVSEAGDW